MIKGGRFLLTRTLVDAMCSRDTAWSRLLSRELSISHIVRVLRLHGSQNKVKDVCDSPVKRNLADLRSQVSEGVLLCGTNTEGPAAITDEHVHAIEGLTGQVGRALDKLSR